MSENLNIDPTVVPDDEAAAVVETEDAQDAEVARKARAAELLEEQERADAEAAMIAADGWDAAPLGKASNFGASFKRMLGLLAPYKLALTLVTLMGTVAVALTVWAPRILGRATDTIFAGFMSNQFPAGMTPEQAVDAARGTMGDEVANMLAQMDNFVPGHGIAFDTLRNILVGVLALYVGSAILSWAQGFIMNVIMVKAMWRLREDVEAKISRLPLSYFDKTKRGDLISRVTNDIENITTTMQQALSGALTSILTVVGVLIMMFDLSWRLALIVLAALPLMAVIFGIIGPRSQKAFALQWRKVGKLNSRVEESISGHSLVKIFGRRADFARSFAEENEELYETSFRAQFLSNIMWPAMSFVGNIVFVVVAVVGGVFVTGGALTLGSVQAFIQYVQQFMQPLGQLGGMAATVQSGVASTERVFEFLDADEQEPDPADAPPAVKGRGVIEFRNVKFSYLPEKPLIGDLSFTVKPGQTCAIVGATGAGKTTLVNLLMRFYDPQGGAILVDGQDIADITRQDARYRTGMVLQDTWLFAGTIRENIRYGKQTATDAEILEAARITKVDRFVHSLPDGYDTVLEEDATNLSAGERQLVTIARAFLRQPEILILDEATSSVDTRTEKLIQNAMASLREGRTSFVIAHRLSTIRDADLILVMADGDIVEKGTHDELMAAGGAYHDLYQSQFTGAIGGDDA